MPHIEASDAEKTYDVLIDFRLEDVKKEQGELTVGNVSERVSVVLLDIIQESLKELKQYPYILALNGQESLEESVLRALTSKLLTSLEGSDEVSELFSKE